jgi:hypothetical protein
MLASVILFSLKTIRTISQPDSLQIKLNQSKNKKQMESIAKFKNAQKIDSGAIWGGVQTCYTHIVDVGATQTPCGSVDDAHYMVDDGNGTTR